MSEHEGFCVPLIEAMYFGLPIISYNAGALSETLADAGVLITEKNFPLIAETINEIMTNHTLRQSLIDAGHNRIKVFSVEEFTATLLTYI